MAGKREEEIFVLAINGWGSGDDLTVWELTWGSADGVGEEGVGADGVGIDGVGTEGVGADGIVADGVGADRLAADGISAEGGFDTLGNGAVVVQSDEYTAVVLQIESVGCRSTFVQFITVWHKVFLGMWTIDQKSVRVRVRVMVSQWSKARPPHCSDALATNI
jgi:hypothetical protein